MKKLILLFMLVFVGQAVAQEDDFYDIIQKNNKAELERGLKEMDKVKNAEQKEVYKGAIKAKIAQFEKAPREKVDLFKKGIAPIEASIEKNPNNVEFRFIRLILQENAPKVLKYSQNIEEDSNVIKKGYKNVSKKIQESMIEYSKNSKVLDFK